MTARLKHWLGNLALLLGSSVVCLTLLEQVVFRFILVPDDLIDNVSINGVVRYQPDTRAVFRHPDGSQTRVTINANGWNSTNPSYHREKPAGRIRVAVIGDSYVHGAFVDVEQGFPEVIEAELMRAGIDAEVYRFGMDGAPMSQYLHMLRREVAAYKPDIVVVQLVHNDFDESYRLLKTRYASSFLKLDRGPSGRYIEVAPVDFRQGTADALRHFRTFRYLYYETNLYLYAKSWVSRLFWGGSEDWSPQFVSSAVDIRNIADHDKNRMFARYVLAEMQALGRRDGFKLAIAMDGVREAIYQGRAPIDYEVGRLNRIAAELTAELDLPLLDLQDTFATDYAANRQRLEFGFDWHWNVRANRLVGAAIARLLQSDPRIGLGRAESAAAGSPRAGG